MLYEKKKNWQKAKEEWKKVISLAELAEEEEIKKIAEKHLLQVEQEKKE
jgi:hypothetical protein